MWSLQSVLYITRLAPTSLGTARPRVAHLTDELELLALDDVGVGRQAHVQAAAHGPGARVRARGAGVVAEVVLLRLLHLQHGAALQQLRAPRQLRQLRDLRVILTPTTIAFTFDTWKTIIFNCDHAEAEANRSISIMS